MRRRWLRRAGVTAVILLLVTPLIFVFHNATLGVVKAFFPAGIAWHGSGARPVVYLTFDDGPDAVQTVQVLDILKSRGVKATFFLPGDRAAAHPHLVQRMCADGHEIANHSNSWRYSLRLSDAEFERSLVAAGRTLSAYPCFRKVFRPAGILINSSQQRIVERHGYRSVLGSAYAFDAANPPAWFLTWATRQALEPGAIVVLHDAGRMHRRNSVAALPRIIDDARRKGLGFEVISQLD